MRIEIKEPQELSIGVYGLGYVGFVSALCFASLGHRVVGVDVNPDKLRSLEQGRPTVVEDGIEEITAQVLATGRLSVTEDTASTVAGTDISMVCVGTPSASNGGLSTYYLEQVSSAIGLGLRDTDRWHVVVFRSTMLPGTCEDLLIPILEEASGKRAGVDFGVCVNPEFLREGTSIKDFFDPPKTVIGSAEPRSSEVIQSIYKDIPGSCYTTPIKVAEMTKYADNSFHALKVAYANEIGAICSSLEIDSHAVMDIFRSDTKLNLGPAYLKPGFAFGGSCLPKDIRAITYAARRRDVEVPLLSNLLSSNDCHLRRAVDLVLADGRRNVGLFGLAFKSGTDDLRESPLVELAERLIGKGLRLRIYDSHVSLSRLVGANQKYITERMPHIGELLTDDPRDVAKHGEILIIGSAERGVVDAVAGSRADRFLIDLIRLPNFEDLQANHHYQGIAW